VDPKRVFLTLALHAKMHAHLDTLDAGEQMLPRPERSKSGTYENEAELQRLNALRQELLQIRFIE
jgi:hypothetical protein